MARTIFHPDLREVPEVFVVASQRLVEGKWVTGLTYGPYATKGAARAQRTREARYRTFSPLTRLVVLASPTTWTEVAE